MINLTQITARENLCQSSIGQYIIESEVAMKRELLEKLYTKPDVTTGENIFYEDELLLIPFSGVVVDFFKGILSWEFEVQDGFKTGIEKTYYETGELEAENETDHNTVHGLSIEYYKSGKVKSKSIVIRNLFVDTVAYNEDGTVSNTKKMAEEDPDYPLVKEIIEEYRAKYRII